MLRLPAEDAVPGPLLIQHEEEEHVEEEDYAAAEAAEARGMLRTLAIVTVPALLLLGGFAWWLMPKDRGQQGGAQTGPQIPTQSPGAQGTDPKVAPVGLAVEVDTVTKNFMEAKTVEEMLRWVRQPEQVTPKVEKWLAGETYKAPGMGGMRGEYRYGMEKGREVIVVPVSTGDFEKRELNLVRESAGLRVDWESWVAWSEMSLEQFRKEKPQEPQAFRVVVTESDYFNFHFKSEVDWSCYRLDSLDGEQSVFGYAPRATEMNSRLGVLLPAKSRKEMLLKLKFPPDARADNQAEIVELVSESWVDLSDAPPP